MIIKVKTGILLKLYEYGEVHVMDTMLTLPLSISNAQTPSDHQSTG